jgi:hypothetical protein
MVMKTNVKYEIGKEDLHIGSEFMCVKCGSGLMEVGKKYTILNLYRSDRIAEIGDILADGQNIHDVITIGLEHYAYNYSAIEFMFEFCIESKAEDALVCLNKLSKKDIFMLKMSGSLDY